MPPAPLRHSACTQIDVELRQVANTLLLNVADNGRGIEPGAATDTGLGLRLMEYRARMIGGALRRVGNAAQGTRIELVMPMPRSR